MTRSESGGLNTAQDLIQIAPETIMERGVFQIVEDIRNYGDFYGQIDVAYLDPAKGGSFTDAPYIVFQRCYDGKARVVFSVWELNASVLERVRAADTRYVDVGELVEKHNAKVREELAKKGREKMQEAGDIYSHALANAKTSYSFPNTEGDIVTLDDAVGIVKRNGQSIEPNQSHK